MSSGGKIPRPPQMRGLIASRMKRHIGIISVISIGAGFSWYWFWMRPKYQKYEDYFKNYDAYKIAEEMCKKNLLHSCPENLAKLLEEKNA